MNDNNAAVDKIIAAIKKKEQACEQFKASLDDLYRRIGERSVELGISTNGDDSLDALFNEANSIKNDINNKEDEIKTLRDAYELVTSVIEDNKPEIKSTETKQSDGSAPGEISASNSPAAPQGLTEEHRCQKCGVRIKENTPYCTTCAQEVKKLAASLPPSPYPHCENCGAMLAANAKTCTKCGVKVEQTGKDMKPQSPRCKNCGAKLADDAVFCVECGVKIDKADENKTDEKTGENVRAGATKCKKCGAKLADGAEFCVECGAKIDNADENKTEEKTGENVRAGEPKCKSCGEELAKDAAFCTKCGTKVESEALTTKKPYKCNRCGVNLSPDTERCPVCGLKA